jgi:hypothetical protein
MGLTMRERHAIVRELAPRFRKATKKQRGQILNALKRLWALSDGLCGKRLVAFIREIVPHLEHQGVLKVADETVRQQVLSVSAATVDRILAKTKHETRLKGRWTIRPGTLLKHHIPVRTFADWNDVQPGFCEADLVAHDGGSAFGNYCHTLPTNGAKTT